MNSRIAQMCFTQVVLASLGRSRAEFALENRAQLELLGAAHSPEEEEKLSRTYPGIYISDLPIKH